MIGDGEERRAHIWPRLNEWLTNLAFPVSLHASTCKDNDKEIKKKRLIVNNIFVKKKKLRASKIYIFLLIFINKQTNSYLLKNQSL